MSAPTSPPTSRRYKGKIVDCNVRLLDDTVHTVRLPVSPSTDLMVTYCHRVSTWTDLWFGKGVPRESRVRSSGKTPLGGLGTSPQTVVIFSELNYRDVL